MNHLVKHASFALSLLQAENTAVTISPKLTSKRKREVLNQKYSKMTLRVLLKDECNKFLVSAGKQEISE